MNETQPTQEESDKQYLDDYSKSSLPSDVTQQNSTNNLSRDFKLPSNFYNFKKFAVILINKQQDEKQLCMELNELNLNSGGCTFHRNGNSLAKSDTSSKEIQIARIFKKTYTCTSSLQYNNNFVLDNLSNRKIYVNKYQVDSNCSRSIFHNDVIKIDELEFLVCISSQRDLIVESETAQVDLSTKKFDIIHFFNQALMNSS
ncbi:hypothetical protein AYI70_g4121 [Smittium culicis]|uniref:FHA domain-containing protein n=1 Tax=Smittium culicis TaxID=133412 RepID=A0A1R1Y0E7_9FUNG|nr:hypothetical protein AYI70_g4121 [Smittium culicis]